MKKKKLLISGSKNPPIMKILRSVKLTMLIVLSINMLVSASSYSKTTRSTLNLNSSDDVKENNVNQQTKSVSGKVTDASGNPLPGVTIILKGKNQGTITNNDGSYSLLNVPTDATLVFSFVGMKTQELEVKSRVLINAIMTDYAIGLDEVVAIGYGTVRRKDLTGSVSSVSSSALKDIPVTSAAQAIAGKMAGVQVTQTEGSPDAEIKIRVRGGGSITQDNSPLYIVDGFPVDNINDIAPTDIESIDILKDASSTAIYGARGANGVVLVTTKNGFEGKTKISYNMYYGIKNITKTLDVLDPYEYVFWQYEILPDYSYRTYFGNFNDMDLYKEMKGTNWQEEILGRTGTSLYNNVSVSGGTNAAKYNISLVRNDDEEIMIGSGYTRTNLTAKTTFNIKKWLKIDLNTRMSDYQLKGAGTGQLGAGESNNRLPHIVLFRPINGFSNYIDDTLIDAGDYEIASTFLVNPLDQTNDDYRRFNQQMYNFNGAAEFKITKRIKYRLEFGIQNNYSINKRFYGLSTWNARLYGEKPLAEIKNTKASSYRIANVLSYSHKNFLPGNNLTILLGEELNSSKSEYVLASAMMFPKYIDAVSALSMMNLGTADPITTLNGSPNKTSSFFGRLNYDYKGKYLFSASIRADGSSKFAPGNQWGYFPAAALAWRVSDEKFMSSHKNWLSNLKTRFSYGQAGNNRIADDSWKKTFSVASGTIFMEGSEEVPTNFLIPESILSNPNLKWEITVTRNAGADFGLFNQRLSGTVEIYKNTTKNLLIRTTIPSNTGYTTQYQNMGQTSNKGIELTLDGVIVDRRKIKLSASFNIGFNRNKIENLGFIDQWETSSGWASADGPAGGDYLVKKGGQVGLMYGYETEGMYSFDDFTYDYATKAYTIKENVGNDSQLLGPKRFGPGSLKLKDQNGDYVVDASDKVVIGNANPKHTGGFNLTAQSLGFDLSVFFNWVYGNDIYNANKLNFTNYQSGRTFKSMLNIMNSDNRFTWISKESGQVVTDPDELKKMNEKATIWQASMSKSTFHSWAVEDGSFLRLNNLTLGYSLPEHVLRTLKIEQLRFYVTGYNLWIWTKYSGYDPEVDTRRSTPLTPGVDWCAYPRSRSYNIGVNLTF